MALVEALVEIEASEETLAGALGKEARPGVSEQLLIRVLVAPQVIPLALAPWAAADIQLQRTPV